MANTLWAVATLQRGPPEWIEGLLRQAVSLLPSASDHEVGSVVWSAAVLHAGGLFDAGESLNFNLGICYFFTCITRGFLFLKRRSTDRIR